jgi:galacturonosyltransferase
VNLDRYPLEKYPEDDKIIKFLFIGRIMKAKGIDELLEAAQRVKKIYTNTKFHLIGGAEEDYSRQLSDMENKGIVKYYGQQDNVRQFIKNAHVVILPSHHEGMANVLLEAAATGRPVLASNVPGCKETFDEGISGFGFEVKNVDSLVRAIIKFINLPYDKKKAMGLAGRHKMEKEYDRRIVINSYLEEINKINEMSENKNVII